MGAGRRRRPDDAPEDPVEADWLDRELDVLGWLVEEGETLEAVSRLSTIVRAPVRGGSALDGQQQVEELGRVAPDSRPRT